MLLQLKLPQVGVCKISKELVMTKNVLISFCTSKIVHKFGKCEEPVNILLVNISIG